MEATKLWTPNEYPAKPIDDGRGNLTVVRPLDLYQEIENFLWEERQKAICERMGVPFIGGGAAGAWTLTSGGRTSLLDGTFDLDTDSFKCALFLSTSNIGAASTTYAGLTNEHAAANGYTTGGIAIALTLSGTTTVTVAVTTAPVWTASGGSIVARFAVVYEVAGNVLAYALLDATPADVTVTTGNTLTVSANSATLPFTLA